MVNANPVATWLETKVTARKANKTDIIIPARIAAIIPRPAWPVTTAAIKPKAAPIRTMPSWPRFNTPDFSHTISPSAIKIRGVPVRNVANKILVNNSKSIILASYACAELEELPVLRAVGLRTMR